MTFCGNSCFEDFGQKAARMEPKIKFFKFCEKFTKTQLVMQIENQLIKGTKFLWV